MKVQTSATLSRQLAETLHGGFVGTIELTCELGVVVQWNVQETFKSGRILERRKAPRDPDRHAEEIAALLTHHDRPFTGKLVLHCNDGAVVRCVRHSALVPGGPDGHQLVDLTEGRA